MSVRDPYGTRSKTKYPGGRSSSTVPATLREHRYARTRVHNHAVPLRVATSGNAASRAGKCPDRDEKRTEHPGLSCGGVTAFTPAPGAAALFCERDFLWSVVSEITRVTGDLGPRRHS